MKYPVAGFELGNEPDLFCRGNNSILPSLMAEDFIALRKHLDSSFHKQSAVACDSRVDSDGLLAESQAICRCFLRLLGRF